MRDSYRHKLTEVVDDVLEMTRLVRTAVQRANTALLDADLAAAEAVISGDAVLDSWYDDLDARCLTLLARESPVAGELRTLTATVRMCADLARMGDLAVHVAKIARMRYPASAVPDTVRPNIERLCQIAEDIVGMALSALEQRDEFDARMMAEYHEEADALRAQQFDIILADDWPHGVQAAVDIALLGRYLERIADHAVLIGSRVIYIVTGLYPKGEQWTIA
ncbi:MAG: phosphate signaling complex protein PhoU [Brooklawnia sp.]|uniref:phosphate signaling complex protein PhoU n=1 Tax=Brooklawnia sp. TaxID=2699740 RepID=UPI003C75746B